jgi:hypothetical protein
MKQKIWIVVLLTSLFTLSAWAQVVLAQNTIQVVDQSIHSRFRDNITAQITAEHASEITNVEFFYRVTGRPATIRNVADFEPGTMVEAEFRLNQRRFYFPPGTELQYWWKLTDAEGNSLNTEPAQYLYLDNRYDFKTLNNDRLTLYWYNGNQAFGQALFRRATRALDRLESDVGVMVDKPIRIFIYGDHYDLLNAISVGAREWTGGVAFTDQGVVVIGIAPEDLQWGLRAMTHELTHLVIHQATDNPLTELPTWLNEGVAVYNESPDELHEDYQETVAEAATDDSLFTLRSLSSSFPADGEAAHLAYGQSGAVFHFMMDTYGPSAMARFLDLFSEGVLVDEALQEALETDTWSIDNAFRASLGLNSLPELVDPRANLHTNRFAQTDSEEADEPADSQESAEPPPVAEQSVVEQVEENNPPTEAETAQTGRQTSSLPCLGGLLSLAALGLVITQRRRRAL